MASSLMRFSWYVYTIVIWWMDGLANASTLQLKDVRSQEGNSLGTTTLLHYLAQLLESKRSDLLTFIDELPHIEAAARGEYARR